MSVIDMSAAKTEPTESTIAADAAAALEAVTPSVDTVKDVAKTATGVAIGLALFNLLF